jgi:hypothetical protein
MVALVKLESMTVCKCANCLVVKSCLRPQGFDQCRKLVLPVFFVKDKLEDHFSHLGTENIKSTASRGGSIGLRHCWVIVDVRCKAAKFSRRRPYIGIQLRSNLRVFELIRIEF